MLVVDDDADVRVCLAEYLCHAGVAASQAVDGQDALDRVRSGSPPCAIVLDLDMPRLTGPELVAALRADAGHAGIPIISMSARRPPFGLRTRAHLAKPFAFEDLLAILFRECRLCGACDRSRPVVGSLFLARQRSMSASHA